MSENTFVVEVDPRVGLITSHLLRGMFGVTLRDRMMRDPDDDGMCLVIDRLDVQVPEECFALVSLYEPTLMIGQIHHADCPYGATIIDQIDDPIGGFVQPPPCPIFTITSQHIDTKPLPIAIPDTWPRSRLLRSGIGSESWN